MSSSKSFSVVLKRLFRRKSINETKQTAAQPATVKAEVVPQAVPAAPVIEPTWVERDAYERLAPDSDEFRRLDQRHRLHVLVRVNASMPIRRRTGDLQLAKFSTIPNVIV
jgi:hypothetical protein